MESTPARHFRTALGQVANFFYTLREKRQVHKPLPTLIHILRPLSAMMVGLPPGEAGAPEFVFNLNVPTRWAFRRPL